MIRDKELQSKLNNQIRYVLKHSNFYKNKFGSLAISETEQDFLDLPFTTKSEILEDQLSNPPFGNNLCVNVSKIQRIHKTSGTTARPLLLALTANDVKHAVQCGAKSFQLSGLTSEHIVIHCLNYNLWSGGYTDHQSLEVAGAGVIPFGVGHTKELIQTIINIKPTAIHCTPSYLKKIESVLIEEFGMLPSDLGLNLGLFGGESGMQNKDFRERIENVWQIKAMNANYGLSDVLSIFGSECFCQNGLHFTGSEVLYPELIDYKTLESVKIREGAIGELVLTNLHKESQPLIRYRTNDIIEIISMEKCKCNETGFRFNVIGRSDDMICIKGVNVFVSAIDKIIYNNSDILTGQYQININRI
jgi:phenylacetate-CoA ligase